MDNLGIIGDLKNNRFKTVKMTAVEIELRSIKIKIRDLAINEKEIKEVDKKLKDTKYILSILSKFYSYRDRIYLQQTLGSGHFDAFEKAAVFHMNNIDNVNKLINYRCDLSKEILFLEKYLDGIITISKHS